MLFAEAQFSLPHEAYPFVKVETLDKEFITTGE